MTDEEYERRISELLAQISKEQFEEIGRLVSRALLISDFPMATVFVTDHRRKISVHDVYAECIGSVVVKKNGYLQLMIRPHPPR